jgi:hypothetical protein
MPDLKEFLAKKFPGVGQDRIAERTQGCWNCIHGDAEKANKLWWDEARAKQLHRAVVIANGSHQGEKDPRVIRIRGQVPLLDAKFTENAFVTCERGVKPDGSAVDTFVFNNYLCSQWTGRQGASVARAGQAADKLPEELLERMHEPKPQ